MGDKPVQKAYPFLAGEIVGLAFETPVVIEGSTAVMVLRPVGIQMVVAPGPEMLGNPGFVEVVAALVLSVDMLIAPCPGWMVAATHFGRVELAVESPPPIANPG